MIRRRDFFFVPALLLLILTCHLRLFLCFILFLLFPCASDWENTRAWVPHALIAILKGPFFARWNSLGRSFFYPNQIKINNWSTALGRRVGRAIVRQWGLFSYLLYFFILTFHFLASSSVSFSRLILAVSTCKCLGKHSCMSSTFHIAMLRYWMVLDCSKGCESWGRCRDSCYSGSALRRRTVRFNVDSQQYFWNRFRWLLDFYASVAI